MAASPEGRCHSPPVPTRCLLGDPMLQCRPAAEESQKCNAPAEEHLSLGGPPPPPPLGWQGRGPERDFEGPDRQVHLPVRLLGQQVSRVWSPSIRSALIISVSSAFCYCPMPFGVRVRAQLLGWRGQCDEDDLGVASSGEVAPRIRLRASAPAVLSDPWDPCGKSLAKQIY